MTCQKQIAAAISDRFLRCLAYTFLIPTQASCTL